MTSRTLVSVQGKTFLVLALVSMPMTVGKKLYDKKNICHHQFLKVKYSINDDDFHVCNLTTGEFITLSLLIHHPCLDTDTKKEY